MKKNTKSVFLRFRPDAQEYTGSGLSNQVGSQSNRVINSGGNFNVRRMGLSFWDQLSVSHELIIMPWWKFLGITIAFYLTVNFLFAGLYFFLGPEQMMGTIAESKSDHFWESFFFSAQTLTTVGYGRINPAGFAANCLAIFESFTGLLLFAIVTGLMYGRFTRPTAKMIFSENALIGKVKEQTSLLIRVANSKTNDLTDVEAQVLLSLVLFEDERFVRRYFNLELERKIINAFPLSWTIVHPINEESPLFNMSQEKMEEMEAEILVVLKGFDVTFSQSVIARKSYPFDKFLWNARFKPSFRRSEDGYYTILELDKISQFDYQTIPEQEQIKA
jgi:inward rectifier potassium channel